MGMRDITDGAFMCEEMELLREEIGHQKNEDIGSILSSVLVGQEYRIMLSIRFVWSFLVSFFRTNRRNKGPCEYHRVRFFIGTIFFSFFLVLFFYYLFCFFLLL